MPTKLLPPLVSFESWWLIYHTDKFPCELHQWQLAPGRQRQPWGRACRFQFRQRRCWRSHRVLQGSCQMASGHQAGFHAQGWKRLKIISCFFPSVTFYLKKRLLKKRNSNAIACLQKGEKLGFSPPIHEYIILWSSFSQKYSSNQWQDAIDCHGMPWWGEKSYFFNVTYQ